MNDFEVPSGYHYVGAPCILIQDDVDTKNRVFSRLLKRKQLATPRETYRDIIYTETFDVS